MKHRLTALILVLLLLLTVTGCGSAQAPRTPDDAEVKLEQKLDALERKLDGLENALEAAMSQPPATAPAVQPEPVPGPTEAPAELPPVPAEPAPEGGLTQQEAEKIALDHAGFTAEQVERMRSNYEIDDGIPQYDVEFFQGDWEYEFEIHAEDGRILSFDKDHKFD